MAISLITNVPSLNAQRNLNRTQSALEGNIGRLSSGLRINRAADDAAGLAISSQLTAQIRGLGQAERNANDAISMIQTAEGALGEVNGILSRMRELMVQGSSEGTLGSVERGFLTTEFTALRQEIDRIAAVTEYNGQTLLDGSIAATEFQVGIFNTTNDQIALTINATDSGALSIDEANLDNADATTFRTMLDTLDAAIETVASQRSDLGAAQNRVGITISNLGVTTENLSAANSRILDVDVASETAALTRNQILSQAGIAVLAQANQLPSAALQLLQ